MPKWYDEYPKVVVEYPPYKLTFVLGLLHKVYRYNEKELLLLKSRVKTTACTYIQDREKLESLRYDFQTREDGSVYKVVLY